MGRSTSRSQALFDRARASIPGGVNSPVRAYRSVGGTPPFLVSGSGAYVTDADGNRYIDYVGSWGPLILGHAHPAVLRAVERALARGASFGAPTELEVELAERVCKLVPTIEKIRMVSSGTEAAMSALRLARGVTGRTRVLKFDGCYHGHADSFLVGAGSGVATLGIPGSPGVPPALAELTLQAPYNDLAAAAKNFERWGREIACAIVEPVAGNMGLVLPEPGFLQGLRELCTRYGALLIFDEVITGFRVALGGAQQRFGISPDLTCLGKVLGGGLPAAAYGGPRELMDRLAPEGPVYQAGTLSGNPLAMAAGLATLSELEKPGTYEKLEGMAQRFATGLAAAARSARIPFTSTAIGGVAGFFFHSGPVRNFADAKGSDEASLRRFFHAMLERGIYLAPSAYECSFVSTAHSDAELDATLGAASECFTELA
jgi:glutamate-1-semialdehyde 2,1-aminomutase